MTKNKVTSLLDITPPDYTYTGTSVNNNQLVVVKITNLIEALQQQADMYLDFTMKITLSYIYNGVKYFKPRTLNADIGLPKDATCLCPPPQEELMDASLAIKTLWRVMGADPNLLKFQEYS